MQIKHVLAQGQWRGQEGGEGAWARAVFCVLNESGSENNRRHIGANNANLMFHSKTVWPSGLRRWLKAPVRKGVGSNPTAVMLVM